MRIRRYVEWLICASIFLVALAIYSNSSVIRVSDSKYTLLLAEQIVDHGNLQLDEYFLRTRPSNDGGVVEQRVKTERHVKERKGHLYYTYPHGTSILSAPFVLAYRALGFSTINAAGEYDFSTERRLSKAIASTLTAATCVLFYVLARVLLPRGSSLVVAATAGLGTQIWSTASTGLWSHTWGVVILSLVLLLSLRAEKGRALHPIFLATLLSWGFFVRPTAAIYIVPFTLYVWLRFRSHVVPFIATGGFWLGLFVLYSFVQQGALPHYYARKDWSFSTFPIGLYAQLLSPSRGLFVYVPSVLIIGYLLVAHFEYLKFRILVNVSLLTLALHAFCMAAQKMWWAGVSYGPRLYTDVVPIFVLLAVIGIDAARGRDDGRNRKWNDGIMLGTRQLGAVAVASCILAGVFINGIGATSRNSGRWDGVPYRANYRPLSTFFEWSNPPFLCALSPQRFCPYRDRDQIAWEFRSLDTDEDGSIDQSEYVGKGFRHFTTADRNGDGWIELEEWGAIYGSTGSRD